MSCRRSAESHLNFLSPFWFSSLKTLSSPAKRVCFLRALGEMSILLCISGLFCRALCSSVAFWYEVNLSFRVTAADLKYCSLTWWTKDTMCWINDSEVLLLACGNLMWSKMDRNSCSFLTEWTSVLEKIVYSAAVRWNVQNMSVKYIYSKVYSNVSLLIFYLDYLAIADSGVLLLSCCLFLLRIS